MLRLNNLNHYYLFLNPFESTPIITSESVNKMPAKKLLMESVSKRIAIITQIIRNKTADVLNFISPP